MRALARVLSGASFALLLHCSAAETTVDEPAPKPVLTPEESQKPATCNDNWVSVAVGRVTTSDGQPIVGATVGYCVKTETNLCLPVTASEKGGWYTYRIDASHRCLKEIVSRADPKDEDLGKYSVSYCPIPLSATNGLLELQTSQVLYPVERPLSPISGGGRRSVSFPSGIELTFAPDDFVDQQNSPKIGAAILDVTKPPCFVKPSHALAMLVAFGPDMSVNVLWDKPKVGFRIPNKAKLPEGSKVELLLLGGFATKLDKEHNAEEGSFEPYGTGTVRNGFIEPDPGSELPALTMLGIRAKK